MRWNGKQMYQSILECHRKKRNKKKRKTVVESYGYTQMDRANVGSSYTSIRSRSRRRKKERKRERGEEEEEEEEKT